MADDSLCFGEKTTPLRNKAQRTWHEERSSQQQTTEAMPDQTNLATAHPLKDLAAYQPGAIVSRMLLKKPGGNVTLFAFGQGQSLSEHTTPHDALVYVVDGEAAIDIDGETHRVAAGETITLPAHIPHAVRAPTDFKMLLIMLKSSMPAHRRT